MTSHGDDERRAMPVDGETAAQPAGVGVSLPSRREAAGGMGIRGVTRKGRALRLWIGCDGLIPFEVHAAANSRPGLRALAASVA